MAKLMESSEMARDQARELYDNALKRLEELRKEAEALTRFISDYSVILGKPIEIENDEHPQLFKAPSQRAAHAERLAEMMDATRKIILNEQRPMKRGELRRRVEALGYEVIGSDKNKVFGTNLWRSGKFRTIEGRGYWPNDVELPE